MNVDQVARRVLGAVGGQTDAGLLLVGSWVSDRYQELCGRGYLRHLRRIGELTVPAVITTGTVSVTQGSKEVFGSADAVAVWATALIDPVDGWSLRPVTTWLDVEGTDFSNNRLLLQSEYPGATGSGLSYRLAQRFLPIDPTARWLGDFVHMRRRHRLDRKSLLDLNALFPDRHQLSGGGPWMIAEATPSKLGAKRVECYPYPTTAELLHYVFWQIPPTLALDDELPPELEWEVLRDGVLVDVFRYNASQAARGGNIEAAAYWRNEYRAQETIWNRRISQGLRSDAAVDDVSMILETSRTRAMPDITTARDIVMDRWPL